jgi:hypothetical protein
MASITAGRSREPPIIVNVPIQFITGSTPIDSYIPGPGFSGPTEADKKQSTGRSDPARGTIVRFLINSLRFIVDFNNNHI